MFSKYWSIYPSTIYGQVIKDWSDDSDQSINIFKALSALLASKAEKIQSADGQTEQQTRQLSAFLQLGWS